MAQAVGGSMESIHSIFRGLESTATVGKLPKEDSTYQRPPSRASRLEHIHITRVDDVKLFDRRHQNELVHSGQTSRSRQNDLSLAASLRKSITALNPLFDLYSSGSRSGNSRHNNVAGNKVSSTRNQNTANNRPGSRSAGSSKCAYHPSCYVSISVTVCVTESHLILISIERCPPTHPSMVFPNSNASAASDFEVWLSHSLIAQCERIPACIVNDDNISRYGFPIRIRCKHFVSFTLVLNREEDAFKLHDTLVRLASPCRLQELPCFTRAVMLKMTLADETSPATATERALERNDARSFPLLFDMVAEWSRQTLPTRHWRISDANRQYLLSETYPELLVLPADASGDVIRGSARFRSKNRLPALSYFHRQSEGAIMRCSQPLSGFNMRSPDDENLLEMIKNCCPRSRTEQLLWLVDVRPKINAYFNRAQGKGYESVNNYVGMRPKFFAVENIHVMRASYEKLYDLFDACVAEQHQQHASSSTDGGNAGYVSVKSYYERLKSCSWLKHIQLLLQAGVFVAEKCASGYSVLVHCSDGWDRTAQVCSLAQLLIDPYYRTIEGFLALIAKDWLAFGHKFTDRCGHLQGPLDKSSDDDAEALMAQPAASTVTSSVNATTQHKRLSGGAALNAVSFAALKSATSIDDERNETFYGDDAVCDDSAKTTKPVMLSSAVQEECADNASCDAEYDICDALSSSDSMPSAPSPLIDFGSDEVVDDPLRAFAAAAADAAAVAVKSPHTELLPPTPATLVPPSMSASITATPSSSSSTVAASSSVTTASTVTNHEQSPIFLQFLDCVYQLLQQNAHEYEFDERLLLALQQAAYSAEYETFVGNSEKQRVEIGIESTAPSSGRNNHSQYEKSFWHHVQTHMQQFVNPVYSPLSLYTAAGAEPVSLLQPLAVDTDIQRIELWYSLYARCNDWLTGAVGGAEDTTVAMRANGQHTTAYSTASSCEVDSGSVVGISQQLNTLRDYIKTLSLSLPK